MIIFLNYLILIGNGLYWGSILIMAKVRFHGFKSTFRPSPTLTFQECRILDVVRNGNGCLPHKNRKNIKIFQIWQKKPFLLHEIKSHDPVGMYISAHIPTTSPRDREIWNLTMFSRSLKIGQKNLTNPGDAHIPGGSRDFESHDYFFI